MKSNYLPFIVTEAFCIAFSVVLLLRVRRSSEDRLENRTLNAIFITYIVMITTDMLWGLMEADILLLPKWLNALINGVEVISITLGCCLWYVFICERKNHSGPTGKWQAAVTLIPAAVICALDLLSVGTGWLYYIDGNGRYQETSLFIIQDIVNFAYLILPIFYYIINSIRTRTCQSAGEYTAYALYVGTLFLCNTVPDGAAPIPLFALTAFAALLILFLVIYVDREKEMSRNEQELAQSRMSIMLSQIQPHFLYNALGVIQDLCHGKAPEAEQATIEFAQFLRGNLDSLTQREPIPFAQELAHTRNYLDLEIKRFGKDALRIEYDIEETDFCLPALSLQPIVENAVHYGVMCREGGGTVKISTRMVAGACVITVEDDGVGFDIMTPHNDGRTHIGISNVRSRIEKMCGGTLVITSVPDKGTTAVIRISMNKK